MKQRIAQACLPAGETTNPCSAVLIMRPTLFGQQSIALRFPASENAWPKPVLPPVTIAFLPSRLNKVIEKSVMSMGAPSCRRAMLVAVCSSGRCGATDPPADRPESEMIPGALPAPVQPVWTTLREAAE